MKIARVKGEVDIHRQVVVKSGGEVVGVLTNPSEEFLREVVEGFKECWPDERVTTKEI
jgi:hypothetical protein